MQYKDKIRIIDIAQTDSTNRFLRETDTPADCFMTVVKTGFQTAGRGQGTNRWESEAGRNLLCSMKFCPENVPAIRQYILLQAAAVAVRDTLAAYADGFTVKWPNDIYFRDRKISGTLSECTVSNGLVGSCIIGIGVNVNQEIFTGDAPNPVSLCHITGRETAPDDVLDGIINRLIPMIKDINAGRYEDIAARYLSVLYRRTGMHTYRDAAGCFSAALETVEPTGHLVLRREDGTLGRYAFKEVEFVIPANEAGRPAAATQVDYRQNNK